ncbi:hypothetical protein PUN28_017541 [Cardiocondyla obscurior]|uniref:Uncharacterized protein n=1 Tax=Cardiocondyla obscurior TaxID=286306 RepID=A0AAW2EHW3_9HYME
MHCETMDDASLRDRTASKCTSRTRLSIIVREDRRLPFQEENKNHQLASLLSSHVEERMISAANRNNNNNCEPGNNNAWQLLQRKQW